MSRNAFRVLHCTEEDLRAVLAFAGGFFQRATEMTGDAIRERFRACPQAFHRVLRNSGGGDALAGYFVLLPLTSGGADRLRRGEIATGRQILAADLASGYFGCPALYLSVVCGDGFRAQAETVRALTRTIVALRRRNAALGELFVRSSTLSGTRTIRRRTGRICPPHTAVERLELADDRLIAFATRGTSAQRRGAYVPRAAQRPS